MQLLPLKEETQTLHACRLKFFKGETCCPHTTRLGGVAHNGFSTAMMLVTTEEYEDQEHENTFFGTIRLEMQNK